MSNRLYRTALPIAALLLAAVLIRFPPGQYTFYPECPLFALTGFQCPGCGSTRALAALLHGNLTAALQHNALIVGLTPFLLAYMVLYFTYTPRSDSYRWPNPPGWALPAAFAIATVFTVARNVSHLHS